jgi:tetratricopeptide (TPR) repeat protein
MAIDGAAFVILGALEAFPRRLAAREIRAQGGELRHGISKRTRFAVLGHRLIDGAASAAAIEARMEAAQNAGARLLSENGFLRLLGLAESPDGARDLSFRQIVEQSGLDRVTFERLALLDTFETAEEPFGFRDLVAARQYAKLAADGVGWLDLVKAARVRRLAGPDGGIANVRLRRAGKDVVMENGPALSELSGQLRLGFPQEGPDPADRLFEDAREAEEAEDWPRATALYHRLAEIEPRDTDVAFNLSHALQMSGAWQEARRYLNKVLRLDPTYAEAWYNLASIAREHGDPESAKRHLRQAITADPGYPDPLYNLALLEFDAESYEQATKLWERYRELDPDSVWGQKAKYGLQLIGMMTGGPAGSRTVSASDRRHLAG